MSDWKDKMKVNFSDFMSLSSLVVIVTICFFFYGMRSQTLANGEAIVGNKEAIEKVGVESEDQTKVLQEIHTYLKTQNEINRERRNSDRERQDNLKTIIKELGTGIINLNRILGRISK